MIKAFKQPYDIMALRTYYNEKIRNVSWWKAAYCVRKPVKETVERLKEIVAKEQQNVGILSAR